MKVKSLSRKDKTNMNKSQKCHSQAHFRWAEKLYYQVTNQKLKFFLRNGGCHTLQPKDQGDHLAWHGWLKLLWRQRQCCTGYVCFGLTYAAIKDKIFSSVGLSYLSKVMPRNLVHTVQVSRCKTGLAAYHICHLYKTSGPLCNEKYSILKALNCWGAEKPYWARLRKDITSTTTDILSSPPKGVLFDEE